MSLATISSGLMIWSIDSAYIGKGKNAQGEEINLYKGVSISFIISYLIAQMIAPTCFLLSLTMLSKIVTPNLRGSFFGIIGVLGSLMIVAIQQIAESTIDWDKSLVFWSSGAFNFTALLLLLVFTCAGKLKH